MIIKALTQLSFDKDARMILEINWMMLMKASKLVTEMISRVLKNSSNRMETSTI